MGFDGMQNRIHNSFGQVIHGLVSWQKLGKEHMIYQRAAHKAQDEQRNYPNRYRFRPVCKFQSHRDVVGQINILSAFKFGAPGKIPAPTNIKYRIPHNVRVLRKRLGTGQTNEPVFGL